MHWKKQDVSIHFDLPANEMRTANLQIMIWGKNQQNSKNTEERHYLVGECFHFISKLIHNAMKEEEEMTFELESDIKLNGN